MSSTTQPVLPTTHNPDRVDWPRLVRNLYWHGKSMGVTEFQRDQEYFRQVQQTLTRLTVGCGILCGLDVSPSGPSGIALAEGAALDGSGRLIIVPQGTVFDDVGQWICADGSPTTPGLYQLCLLHHDCPVDPAPVAVTACDTTTDCLAGAAEERYRIELRPVAGGCDEDGCDGCGSPSQSCRSACDDCVVLGRLAWNGQEVVELMAQGRRLISSNTELADHLDLLDTSRSDDAPRLCGLWPAPGSVLSRTGSPSAWARWRQRPRIELTFDQPIEVERIDDPDDWLRAWIVTEAPSPAGPINLTFNRVGLDYMATASRTGEHRHRLIFEFKPRAMTSVRSVVAVVIQARANTNTGPISDSPLARVAQINYDGTGLPTDLRSSIWEAERLTTDEATASQLIGTPQPQCFGDGYDGGNLHVAFAIEPLEPGVGPIVTAVHPANASRSGSSRLPALEISSTAELQGLSPRAWLVDDGGHIELPLQGEPLPPDERPAAADRFPASFDNTVTGELAATIRYAVDESGLGGRRRGRVLVIVPAYSDAHPSVGSFRGTCLNEADVARIHSHGLTADDYQHIRPSDQRMPRSGQSGAWVHWTFLWEQNNGDIN